MTTDEITHLGRLSRIALTDTEITGFRASLDAILAYVSVVKDIAASEASDKAVGARFNVLRADDVTNTPGSYTEVLLTAMPKRDGQYMSVKKILQQSE